MAAPEGAWQAPGLDPRLLAALDKRGFARPTPVQAAGIPKALEGKDLIARARTGSGKTLAYLLPALHKILAAQPAQQRAGWQALVLVPTRELCEQVREEADAVATRCGAGLRVTALGANLTAAAQRNAFLHAGQLVVATPGQIAQALRGGQLRASALAADPRMRRAGLQTLVLDEADLMLAMPGYEDDLRELAPQIPRGCQCLLMSASMNTDVERLQKLILHSPEALDLTGVQEVREHSSHTAEGSGRDALGTSLSISHYCVECSPDDRLLWVLAMLRLGAVRKKVLLFVNSAGNAYRLRLFLEAFGVHAAALSGELPLNSRHHILQEFNKGLFDYLIAADDPTKGPGRPAAAPEPTAKRSKKRPRLDDSASGKDAASVKAQDDSFEFGVTRGIDFKGVQTVVNVDAPRDVTGYVHRTGRTGRGGRAGTAITLLTPADCALAQQLRDQLAAPNASKGGGPGKPGAAGRGLQPFEGVAGAAVEALRYRAADVLRSITAPSVKEARAKELRLELLNSARLAAHFEAHPGDLALLRHDKPLAKVAAPEHLRHLPGYLRAAAPQGAASSVGTGRGVLPYKKRRKMERGQDPLKAGFVRAPKRGGDIGEPLTEMEAAAEKTRRKAARKQGGSGAFTAKRNVRKHQHIRR